MSRAHRLGLPRPARVCAGKRGEPEWVDGRRVEAIRESWVVEDRWWTESPLRRRYWELVTERGRNVIVFRDLDLGGWYAQRA